jgi:hypothetical protein
MPCAFCGEGDKWIKTCQTRDGSRLQVCDPCWEILSSWLVVVPGDGVVTARCDGCGAYFNPREMAEVSPGGRHDGYSGMCEACAGKGSLPGRVQLRSVSSVGESTRR